MKKNQPQPLPSDISAVCQLNRCDALAIGVEEIFGHPNRREAYRYGYCAEHIRDRFTGFWMESSVTYRVVFTGPYLPRSK